MATRSKSKSTDSAKVDRELALYRSMRDFQVTSEPRGNGGRSARGASALPFVVQKHAATRLHYDFRLGWRGVLKSWAVTKGPSTFPGDKRLAVQVEDHPIEYGGFEGTIPKGQYGGGTVMVWDRGDWVPLGDVDPGLEDGHLNFELHGEKLKGTWALVRMHGRASRSDKRIGC
jgi:bifunctional non-homologous end joining protein LigD